MSHVGYLRHQERLAATATSDHKKKRTSTMTQFAEFTPPENTEGDRFIPKDNIGHVIVIKAAEHKTGIVTSNSPAGTDAIGADVLDLDAPDGPAVYRDTLLFGGAFTDALKNYIGQVVVVKIEQRKSASNRLYCVPSAVEAADTERAKAVFDKGDPFAPAMTTVGAATAQPPF